MIAPLIMNPIIKQARSESRLFLTEIESKRLLGQAGISCNLTKLATSTSEAISLSNQLGYPVALKIASPDIIHKNDSGGVRLEDSMTHPAKVKSLSSPPFNYSITIQEGRNRQVRRMFERLKHPILTLKRIRIGNLNLGDLKEGEVQKLNINDIKALLDS